MSQSSGQSMQAPQFTQAPGSRSPSVHVSAARTAFEAWLYERRSLEERLNRTPERTDPAGRDVIFDRIFELERLILSTPSDELSEIRVKAEVLLWLMETERADGAEAMRHIHSYLAAQG